MEPLNKITVLDKCASDQIDDSYKFVDSEHLVCKKMKLRPFLQKSCELKSEALNVDDCTLEQYITNDSVLVDQAEDEISQPSTSTGVTHATSSHPQATTEDPLTDSDTLVNQGITKVLENKSSEQPQKDRKLLVLDLDLTIFDCKADPDAGYRRIRPYLQTFLLRAYVDYDIIIWSATTRFVIDRKLDFLGIRDNKHYKIMAIMDRSHMVNYMLPNLSVISVKSLQTVWDTYKQFNHTNTIICDDYEKNFYMNKKNGVLITRYHYENYKTDKELIHLSKYVKYICNFADFSTVDHTCWRESVVAL